MASDPIEVLITVKLPEASLEALHRISPRLHIESRPSENESDIPEEIWQQAEVLLTGSVFPPPQAASHLRWVQVFYAGIDNVPAHIQQSPQITLTNASGVHATQMAEYVMGTLLSLAQRVPQMLHDQSAHFWPGDEKQRRYQRLELRGLTVGIIGYGSIGREVARLATPFGVRILAAKRNPLQHADQGWTQPGLGDPEGRIPVAWYGLDNLGDLLAASDVVVLALPATADTDHLINAETVAQMKAGGLLINVGRGNAVDESALVEALRAGKLGGAALDVFEQEPLPASSPLWDLPNVIISPHISGNSRRYAALNAQLFGDNLRRYLAGEPLYNRIDSAVGY